MSGVLQRLVGRATGVETSGLRPRLPGLFEGGTGELGFREVAEEVVAPQVADAWQAAEVPAQGQLRPAVTFEPAASPVRPAPLLPPAHVPSQPPTVAAHFAVIEPPVVADDAPAAPLKAAEPRVSTVIQTLAPVPIRPAPPPLLPVLRPERLEQTITTRLAEPTPARPQSLPQQPTEAAPEPEITIHIGRLDIRSETPTPRPASRASQQPSLPSLADYLRGGRR